MDPTSPKGRLPRGSRPFLSRHSRVMRNGPSSVEDGPSGVSGNGAAASARRSLGHLAATVVHLGPQAGQDARVHLADAALREIEGRADLLHRHLFEVVERDDELLGAGEALAHELLEILALKLADRVAHPLVLEHVDLADVLVAVGLV